MRNNIVCVLMLTIITSCAQQIELEGDIDRLVEINSNIGDYKTEILQMHERGEFTVFNESISKKEEHYTASYEFEKSDTAIAIVYRCREYNNRKTYGGCAVAKQYNEGELKHEASLFNNDTLYHYTTVLSGKAPRFFVDYNFKTGKYFYMFMCNSGLLSEGQYIYFMQNIDSLRKIKGNILPELPSIDSISLREYRENGTMQKVFENNLFL